MAKAAGLRHIPIFPLPLVLLPNESLPLHIFEDRYRKMLGDSEQYRNCFGLSYFDPDKSIIDRPAIGSVGCLAEIKQSELLSDGRSNILTTGVVRYRIVDYVDSGEPYLMADVGFFEDEDSSEDLVELSDTVFKLFERMAKAAFKLSGSRGQLPEITQAEPEALSFLVTAAFNFENDKKYSLLEMNSTAERLASLRSVLVRAVGKLEESADMHSIIPTNGHSKKKLDL